MMSLCPASSAALASATGCEDQKHKEPEVTKIRWLFGRDAGITQLLNKCSLLTGQMNS